MPEVLAYLRSAAAVDGTRPGGTVYLCQNANVRSKTRVPFFPLVMRALEERGRKVELLQNAVLPAGKEDVIGAVVGSASFSWAKSKSKILPGAIVEHLTSHGANFGTPGQTKISELLRHGAAGSSGTVAEPYAVHQKFPNPAIHVFYADGCSLAEAYFQSVWGPYQLMIVGDGLARPYARFEEIETSPLVLWRDVVHPSVNPSPGTARMEVWAGGRRVAEATAGEPLAVDSTKLPDGHVDVRVVAVADGPVATRSYTRYLGFVNNRNRKVEIRNFNHKAGIRSDPDLVIRADGASSFRLVQGSRVLATAADGKLTLTNAPVGPGRFTVVPEVVYPDGSIYRCRPVIFDLDQPDRHLAASAPLPENPRPGLVGDGRVFVTSIGDRRAGLRLRDQVAKGPVTLNGFMEIREMGDYELVATGSGRLRVIVDDQTLFDGELQGRAYLTLSRDKGWHPVRIECEPNLELMLGGAQVLAPPALRHAPPPALKQQPRVAKKFASLRDGKRDDAGVEIEELVLRWTRAVKIGAVTLHPGKGADTFAPDCAIETSTGYGKWKMVKDLRRSVARPPRTAKGKPEIPLFVEFAFEPVRAKKLRLRLKGQATVAEFEVHGAPR